MIDVIDYYCCLKSDMSVAFHSKLNYIVKWKRVAAITVKLRSDWLCHYADRNHRRLQRFVKQNRLVLIRDKQILRQITRNNHGFSTRM